MKFKNVSNGLKFKINQLFSSGQGVSGGFSICLELCFSYRGEAAAHMDCAALALLRGSLNQGYVKLVSSPLFSRLPVFWGSFHQNGGGEKEKEKRKVEGRIQGVKGKGENVGG